MKKISALIICTVILLSGCSLQMTRVPAKTAGTPAAGSTGTVAQVDRSVKVASYEIKRALGYSVQELRELMGGDADKAEDVSHDGGKYKKYTYGDNVIETDTDGSMTSAALFDNRIPHLRGITIDMPYRRVIEHFPKFSENKKEQFTGGQIGEYSLIYGRNEDGTDHAMVVYEGQEPREIRIFAGSYKATIYFENLKVSKMIYSK